MKVVMIMSETSLWKPVFVNDLISQLPQDHSIDGIVITSFKPEKFSFAEYLRRYYNILGFRSMMIVGAWETMNKLLNAIDRKFNRPNLRSIEGVARKFRIPVFHTPDINTEDTIEWISQFEPDILFNSNHQIYGARLLALPKKYCVNRHSSILPGYRGVYPVFWYLLHDAGEVGVTVHTMEKKLDAGKIIVQKRVPIEEHDTMFSLYEKCFKLAVGMVIEAFDKIGSGNWEPVVSSAKPSYYSFPSKEVGKEFRKKGKRIF